MSTIPDVQAPARPDSRPGPDLRSLPAVLVSWHPAVHVEHVGSATEIDHVWGRTRLRGLTTDEQTMLDRLARTAVPVNALLAGRLGRQLWKLRHLLTLTVNDEHGPALTAMAMVPGAPRTEDDELPRTQQLSRFALLRRVRATDRLTYTADAVEPDMVALESPLSTYRVFVHSPALRAFVTGLLADDTRLGLGERAGHDRPAGLDPALAGAALELLRLAGMTAWPNEPTSLWELHDLYFHTRSRYGMHDGRAGGDFAHLDRPHAPALVRHTGTVSIDLDVPDLDEVASAEPGLTEVMEGRRSYRTYRDTISKAQLSHFLYRCGRVRGVSEATGAKGYAAVDRPYPAGGGMGELEIYPVVHSCDGILPGCYWYDSAAHRMVLRNDSAEVLRSLAGMAITATGGMVTQPQVQLLIASRLARLQWKYSSIAYAVTLKHVGVLMQTMYLVATAMGLSPCGNGSGENLRVAAATGVPWSDEAPVGEFLLGGSPGPDTTAPGRFADIVAASRNDGGDAFGRG